MEKKKLEKWYDNGYIITGMIIFVILMIIICSQSFVNGELSFALFSSVINHNSIYLLLLVYFIMLSFPFGKKYFNYLNLFLLFIYFIATVTSLLTVFQSFKLVTVLNFVLNIILFLYSIHTLLRGTRFWKEFNLGSSPFHELTNDGIFYGVIVISVLLLIVNLINAVVVSGVVISLLDTFYYVLFGRYIYIYWFFLDKKKIDANSEGNFDEFRGKVQEKLDQTEIDDILVEGIKDVKNAFTGEKKKEVEEENHPEESVKEKESEEKEIVIKKTVKKKTVKKGE